jgi:hypothetical protein
MLCIRKRQVPAEKGLCFPKHSAGTRLRFVARHKAKLQVMFL